MFGLIALGLTVVETVSVIEATAAVVTAIGTTAVGIAKLVEATKN